MKPPTPFQPHMGGGDTFSTSQGYVPGAIGKECDKKEESILTILFFPRLHLILIEMICAPKCEAFATVS